MGAFELLLCATLIFISAYMAASEVALFSLSRFQLRSLKERMAFAHRNIKQLLADPSGLLVTLLVVSETTNIALSALITRSVSESGLSPHFPSVPPWTIDILVGTAITAPLVLFVAEATPKIIAARANQLVAAVTSGPLVIVYTALKPVRRALKRLLVETARRAGPAHSEPGFELDAEGEQKLLRESDFLQMVEEGHKEGAIHHSELELIKNVFELDDTTVADVYTPLSQVQSLPSGATIKAALGTVRGQRYSRIPVLSPNRKQVVGLLYSKDMLRARLEPELLSHSVNELVRKPFFVAPSLRLNTLFRKFKQQKTHMAVVRGPGGEAMGVVTMSDVLDTLFEDVLGSEEEGEGRAPKVPATPAPKDSPPRDSQ